MIKFHCVSVSRSEAGGSKKAPPANQQKRGSPCGQSPGPFFFSVIFSFSGWLFLAFQTVSV
jgi:hypothetical protein